MERGMNKAVIVTRKTRLTLLVEQIGRAHV